VTSLLPAKVNALSVAVSIAADVVERGRAICTDVKCKAWVPNALDRCTRTSAPPAERRKICRTVESRRSSVARAFCGSGIPMAEKNCFVLTRLFAERTDR
jgi:hypothetical protein